MKRFIIITLTLAVCTFTLTAKVSSQNPNSKKKTIALDPGHGGHDKGAQGPDGTLEKNVTLMLAKMLETELNNTYNVILTRSDDYWMDAHTRTAVANHAEADLFISIHTGGSFLHQANKTCLYYYKKFSDQNNELGASQNRTASDREDMPDWINIHRRHQEANRLVAKCLKQGLEQDTAIANIETNGVPLLILEGADMPAVLLELGYITNPTLEKSFRDPVVLANIVKGIKRGIDDFFESVQLP